MRAVSPMMGLDSFPSMMPENTMASLYLSLTESKNPPNLVTCPVLLASTPSIASRNPENRMVMAA